jgi:hypothetical protein
MGDLHSFLCWSRSSFFPENLDTDPEVRLSSYTVPVFNKNLCSSNENKWNRNVKQPFKIKVHTSIYYLIPRSGSVFWIGIRIQQFDWLGLHVDPRIWIHVFLPNALVEMLHATRIHICTLANLDCTVCTLPYCTVNGTLGTRNSSVIRE